MQSKSRKILKTKPKYDYTPSPQRSCIVPSNRIPPSAAASGAYLMDGMDAPGVEQNALRQGSFPAVDVG